MAHYGLVLLVVVKTRIEEEKAEALENLADKNGRSVASELRVAIDKHLSDAAQQEDGRT